MDALKPIGLWRDEHGLELNKRSICKRRTRCMTVSKEGFSKSHEGEEISKEKDC